MNCAHQQSDLSLIKKTLEKYGDIPGSLITILQHAQEVYGYLPADVLIHIAERTGTKQATVFGVATFYSQFRLEPVGKNLILLCQGTACHVNGSKSIETAICDHLGISDGETTKDGQFTLKNVACLGCCSLSPVMMINDETYGNLTDEAAVKILKGLAEND